MDLRFLPIADMVASSTDASDRCPTVGTSPRSLTSTMVLPSGLMSGWMATVDQKPWPVLNIDCEQALAVAAVRVHGHDVRGVVGLTLRPSRCPCPRASAGHAGASSGRSRWSAVLAPGRRRVGALAGQLGGAGAVRPPRCRRRARTAACRARSPARWAAASRTRSAGASGWPAGSGVSVASGSKVSVGSSVASGRRRSRSALPPPTRSSLAAAKTLPPGDEDRAPAARRAAPGAAPMPPPAAAEAAHPGAAPGRQGRRPSACRSPATGRCRDLPRGPVAGSRCAGRSRRCPGLPAGRVATLPLAGPGIAP